MLYIAVECVRFVCWNFFLEKASNAGRKAHTHTDQKFYTFSGFCIEKNGLKNETWTDSMQIERDAQLPLSMQRKHAANCELH